MPDFCKLATKLFGRSKCGSLKAQYFNGMLYKANYLLCVEDITTYSAYNKLSSI